MKRLLTLILSLASFSAFADFPIPAFFQPVRNLDALKAMGINTVAGPEVENAGSMKPADLATARDAWLKATADKGLKVILKNPPPTLPSHCVGVMLTVDEPNGRGVNPAAMKAESDAYRAKYPGVPILISLAGDKVTSANFNRPDEKKLYEDYAALADIITIDMYSRNRNASRYTDVWSGEGVKKLALITDKPVWVWLEVNDQQLNKPTPPDVNRAPTPAEIKAQWEYAVKCGAKGIGAFLTCDSGKYGWPESYFPQTDRDGKSMKPQYDMFRALALAANPAPAPVPSPVEIELAKVKADLTAAQVELAAVRGDLDAARADAANLHSALDISESTRKAAASQAATLTETLKGPQPPPATRPSALLVTPSNLIPPSPAPFGEANWLHPAVIARDKPQKDFTQADIERVADACENGDPAFQPRYPNGVAWGPPLTIYRRAPTFLDYENAAIDVATVRQHLLWFKAKAPHVPVGVIGYPYYDANGDPAPFKPVRELEDFLNGGGYLNGPDSLAGDLKIIRDETARIQNLYPGKPMFFWTAAQYKGKELAQGDAAAIWALGREQTPGAADRIVLYCDLPGAYDVTKRAFGGMK